jgi:glycosyltransferase involved in cell wall biosynthesis
LPDCDFFSPPQDNTLHGAFLATSKFLRWVANAPEFERLEVFLPPAVIADHDTIQKSAEHLLEPQSRGQGRLSFYPYHSLPEVWSDGVPRILRSGDPSFMSRDRYFRDLFAQGPVAMSVDTHVIGTQNIRQPFRQIIDAYPAPFDSIQCISNSMKEVLERTLEELGCKEAPFRLDVIQRPVDTKRFRPPTPQERIEARHKLGIPENANVAIYHSRVGPHSKADIYPFIQAFAECSGPNDWLIIGGPPSSETAYENIHSWLQAANVDHRCRLIGPCQQQDVPGRLWAADFFVLPCDNPSEGLGIAPIEAMACGLPSLVSDWDGMREAVRDGINGMFVPTHWFPGSSRIGAFSPLTPFATECMLLSQCIVLDQVQLEEKLGQMFHDLNLRKRLQIGAIETIQDWSDSAINRRLLQTFQEQLLAAINEPAAEREVRREKAKSLGMPTNYETILPYLASRAVQVDDLVELSPMGHSLLNGQSQMAIYEEVSMLARPQDISAVLEAVRFGPKTVREIIELLGPKQFSDGFYVLAFLTKRNILRLTRKVLNE